MVEWRNGGKGLTNWSGSCMIFVCLYEVNNTKNPSKKGMETDMSERKQAPETPWYLRPFGPLVSLALLCVVWGVYGKARLSGRRTRAQRAWQVVSQGCVYDLGRDLTRHNLLPVLQPGQPVFGLFCPGYGGAVRRLYLPGADPLQQSRRRGNRAVYRPGLQPHLPGL